MHGKKFRTAVIIIQEIFVALILKTAATDLDSFVNRIANDVNCFLTC